MPDYQKGKIYTLRCRTDDTLIYVGSTIQPLAVRWGGHKVDSRKERCKNRLIYRTINGEWDNWYIELYENFACENKEQLCKREGEIIRLIGNLNVRIEARTVKEREEDNKDKRQEQNKIWRENNKEKRKEYDKKRREENKEKQNEQNKIWREKNKGILSEKIPCECGCMIRRGELKRHLKSKKHINLMEQLTN